MKMCLPYAFMAGNVESFLSWHGVHEHKTKGMSKKSLNSAISL
jgi:hypothetical protein